jgi:hypothetical protein
MEHSRIEKIIVVMLMKFPSDYPHELRACDLNACLNGVTVLRSRAHVDESNRRDIVFAPRRRA